MEQLAEMFSPVKMSRFELCPLKMERYVDSEDHLTTRNLSSLHDLLKKYVQNNGAVCCDVFFGKEVFQSKNNFS